MWATVLFTDLTGLDASKCVTGQSAFHAGNSITVFDRLCKGFLQFWAAFVWFPAVVVWFSTVPRRCCVDPCGSPWWLCSSPGVAVQSPARVCSPRRGDVGQPLSLLRRQLPLHRGAYKEKRLKERRSQTRGGALFASAGSGLLDRQLTGRRFAV